MEKNKKICWICGNPATTREHQLKKTDVVALFGNGSYKKGKIVKTDLDKNREISIQSANSDELKHEINLCSKCNNERTQPYDKAYEEFSEYIRNNFKEIKRNGKINFNLIFGKRKSKKNQRNLFFYFIKSFGCRLDKIGLLIPNEIKDAILGKIDLKNTLKISIFIGEKGNYLQNMPFDGLYKNGKHSDYLWGQYNGWFLAIYTYNNAQPKSDEWCGKSKKFNIANKVKCWEDLIDSKNVLIKI